MAEKLKHAQTLLDGLATNDFRKITKSSDELLIISKTAEFIAAHKTREYELHTNSFRRALDAHADGQPIQAGDLRRLTEGQSSTTGAYQKTWR